MIDWELELARQKALEAAYKLVSGRVMTAGELAKKLHAKEHEPDVVEWAMGRAVAHGLVDDAAYARTFLRQRSARGHGPRRIRQDLAKRGVDPVVVEQAFAEGGPTAEAELERCGQLLGRKFDPAQLGETKVRAKAFRFLVARGYEAGVAERAIGTVRAAAD